MQGTENPLCRTSVPACHHNVRRGRQPYAWFLGEDFVLEVSLEGIGVQRPRCFSICLTDLFNTLAPLNNGLTRRNNCKELHLAFNRPIYDRLSIFNGANAIVLMGCVKGFVFWNDFSGMCCVMAAINSSAVYIWKFFLFLPCDIRERCITVAVSSW